MAAFTEARGQSMRSINDLLNMRNQRKQANADRIVQGGQFAAGLMQQSSEAEKDREAQLERIGATGEEQRATEAAKYEPFPDGPREIVDAATGRVVTVNTPAEYDVVTSQLQGFRGQEQMEFTDEQREKAQADALERMRLESKLNINELDAQEQSQIRIMEQELKNEQSMLDFERAKYENGMYQTQDGAVFRWSDPETYRAALDEIGQHTQKLAGISSRNPVVWEVYKDAVGRAKEQMWAPEYDENGRVVWERTDVTQEKLMENFVAELPMTGMSEADRNNAIEAFRTYLINAEQSPPQDFSETDGGGNTTINIPRDNDYRGNDIILDPLRETRDALQDVADLGSQTAPASIGELLANIGNWGSIERDAPNAPEGVENRRAVGVDIWNEDKLWNALTQLASQMEESYGDDRQDALRMDTQYNRIQDYISDLEGEGKAQNYSAIEQYLKDMFTQAGMIR